MAGVVRRAGAVCRGPYGVASAAIDVEAAKEASNVPRRVLWLTVGLLATGCGVAGIVLPLVPTTPFLLLAAFAFARSSPGLHEWLVTHPRLGPPLSDWQAHGAIRRRSKIAALIVMLAALALTTAAGARLAVILAQAAVLALVAAFVLSRPDAPDGEL